MGTNVVFQKYLCYESSLGLNLSIHRTLDGHWNHIAVEVMLTLMWSACLLLLNL